MARTVLFDAGRLLQRSGRTTPTGVDRVCLAYAEWLMGHPDVRFVPVRSRGDHLTALDRKWFSDLAASLRERWTGNGVGEAERTLADLLARPRGARSLSGPVSREREPRRQAMTRLLMSRALPEVSRGTLYVNVGHSGLTSPRLLSKLAEDGARSVLMVHDLIPITHPEYCRPGEGGRHRTRMRLALKQGSVLVVNSDTTAKVLRAFAQREGLATPTVVVAHLGLEPPFTEPGWRPAGRPYFVHVGTVEARKNLTFLLTLWRRLEELRGAETPALVLIGRNGWENESVMDHLERSPPLQGLVHQASELPDEALSRLMRASRGVVAPSAVEGFDLPAVEAMAMGVPLIASDIAAHRELVPKAKLIDPLDGPGWLKALDRAARGDGQPPPYKPPTWASHFQIVAEALGMKPGV